MEDDKNKKDDLVVKTIKEEYEKKLQEQKDEYEKKLQEKDAKIKETEEKCASQVRSILTGSRIVEPSKKDDEDEKSYFDKVVEATKKRLKI